jgi:hypothetical protein
MDCWKKFLLALVLMYCSGSYAQDNGESKENLEGGFGAQIEDAFATEKGNLEFQMPTLTSVSPGSEYELQLQPGFEWGIFQNAEMELSVPLIFGNGERIGSGDIRLGFLYNFFDEGKILPALTLIGRADFPTGLYTTGMRYALTGIVTKTLGPGLGRAHLNYMHVWNPQPVTLEIEGEQQTEAGERRMFIAGYSREIIPKTFLIVNYIYEELWLGDEKVHYLGGGLIKELSDKWQLAGGASFGLSNEQAYMRLNLGVIMGLR